MHPITNSLISKPHIAPLDTGMRAALIRLAKTTRTVCLALLAGSILYLAPVAWADNCDQARALFRQSAKTTDFQVKLKLLNQAARLCPDEAAIWNNLADAEENLGRTDQAIIHYQKALSINPNLAVAHFSLGDIHFHRGEYQKALDSYSAGLKLEPGDSIAMRNRQEAESRIQASGGVLSAEYITSRLQGGQQEGDLQLMGVGGSRARAGYSGQSNQLSGQRSAPSKMAFQNILFDSGSAKIKASSHAQLKELGLALKDIFRNPSARLFIEGHTDNRGSAGYNQKLSQKRSESVRHYLAQRFSLDRNRMEVRGFGITKPVASNDTAEGRAKNRRVEITLTQ